MSSTSLFKSKKSHYDTLTRVKIQDTHQFLLTHSISFDARFIFDHFEVSQRTKYEILHNESSRTRHHTNETRDRKRKLSDEQIAEADHILQDEKLQLKEKRYT